jgi:hypothetical protein
MDILYFSPFLPSVQPVLPGPETELNKNFAKRHRYFKFFKNSATSFAVIGFFLHIN